jgi:hypothetical protein
MQIVSGRTIDNSKQTFIHEMVKPCRHVTTKTVRKGYKKVNKSKKRNIDGKFANAGRMDKCSEESANAGRMDKHR